jgi:hypothetical protein
LARELEPNRELFPNHLSSILHGKEGRKEGEGLDETLNPKREERGRERTS